MSDKSQHVMPSGGKWTVRTSGAGRASHVFSTQEEAVKNARDRAKRDGTELYIHGRDGRIRDRHTYADPRHSG